MFADFFILPTCRPLRHDRCGGAKWKGLGRGSSSAYGRALPYSSSCITYIVYALAIILVGVSVKHLVPQTPVAARRSNFDGDAAARFHHIDVAGHVRVDSPPMNVRFEVVGRFTFYGTIPS